MNRSISGCDQEETERRRDDLSAARISWVAYLSRFSSRLPQPSLCDRNRPALRFIARSTPDARGKLKRRADAEGRAPSS
jgi:hypothetical protein